MDCVSACKISIPAYSTSPGPLQEAEALQAALAIERLSAEVSLFPPRESAQEGRLRSASEPSFTSLSRIRRAKRKACNVDHAHPNISPGSLRLAALSGVGKGSTPSPPADDSFDLSSYRTARSSYSGESQSPTAAFLPRFHSFPPVHRTPTPSGGFGSPERTQDSFPLYSPPHPADLARLKLPGTFVVHVDRTPPLDDHPKAWLSPPSFTSYCLPSARAHREGGESPTTRKPIHRKPVPAVLTEEPVQDLSFMPFPSMNSFPLVQPTEAPNSTHSITAKAFRRSDRVRNYSLRYFLSQGAQGKVYLATGGERKKLCAIKVISKLTVESFRTLLQEQKLLRRIKGHRFVLNMVDSFHDTENFYLVTDYYPGGDLAHLLYKLGVFETDMARFYISELVVAVDFLHERQIVHRDLKPGNILIKSDGHICIVDFGLCKDFKSVSSPGLCASDCLSHDGKSVGTWPTTNGFAGTLVYMSPQAVNQDRYSYETDWWSMGIILYELLQGDTPWVGSDISTMVKKIRYEPLVFRKDVQIDSDALDFIEKLLQKEVESRISPLRFESHKFFRSAKFTDVEQGLLIPPFIPQYNERVLSAGCLQEADRIYVGRQYDSDLDPFPEYNYADASTDLTTSVDIGSTSATNDRAANEPYCAESSYRVVNPWSPRPRLMKAPVYTKHNSSKDKNRPKGTLHPVDSAKLLNLPVSDAFGPMTASCGTIQVAKRSLLPQIACSLFRLSAAFSRSVLYSEHFGGTSAFPGSPPSVALSHLAANPVTTPAASLAPPAVVPRPAPLTMLSTNLLPLPATTSLTPPLPSMLTVSSIRAANSLFSLHLAGGSATQSTLPSYNNTSVLVDLSSNSAASPLAQTSRGKTSGHPATVSTRLHADARCGIFEAWMIRKAISKPTQAAQGVPASGGTWMGFTSWVSSVIDSVAGWLKRIGNRLRMNSTCLQNDVVA